MRTFGFPSVNKYSPILITECSQAIPGSPCTNLEAGDCKYEHIGDHCCCGQCSNSPWLSLACVLNSTTGAQFWQPDSLCPAEGCGSEGEKEIIYTFTFFRSHVERLLSTGVVSSPNYPGNYPNNHHLTQIIEVEQGLIVLLKFTAFDIEYQWNTNGITCAFDHLTITDGDGSSLMERSCGSTIDGTVTIGSQLIFSSLPPDVRSRSNVVNLEFSTNYVNVMTGWSVTWSAVTPSGKC